MRFLIGKVDKESSRLTMGKKTKDYIKFAEFCAKYATIMGKDMNSEFGRVTGKIEIPIPKSAIRELLSDRLDEVEYASVKTEVFRILRTTAEGERWENTYMSDDHFAYRLQFAMISKW